MSKASNNNTHLGVRTRHIQDDAVTLAKMAAATRGDLIIYNSSGDPAVTNVGAAETVLQSDGTDPAWVDPRATQANMEAATDETVYVTAGRQKYHPGTAKAWGFVDYNGGSDPTLDANYNITSAVDGGVIGDLDVTIATDLGSADYCIIVGASGDSSGDETIADDTGKAVGTVTIRARSGAGAADRNTSWVIFGDFA